MSTQITMSLAVTENFKKSLEAVARKLSVAEGKRVTCSELFRRSAEAAYGVGLLKKTSRDSKKKKEEKPKKINKKK
jgi:hypothetical protein